MTSDMAGPDWYVDVEDVALLHVASIFDEFASERLQAWGMRRDWNDALREVSLPGRFQRTGNFIFDVAHNPAGAKVLAENLRAVSPPPPLTALMAVLSDKDWKQMIDELRGAVSRFSRWARRTLQQEYDHHIRV